MLKCTGICSSCGRCREETMPEGQNQTSADSIKERHLHYPGDFVPDRGGKGFGLAFDIGTSTVVGILWDLNAGRQLAACARTNPQREFGADLISRLAFSMERADGLLLMQNKILNCVNEIIEELCFIGRVDREEINRMNICGNTVMSHIFIGYSPEGLAMAPFEPAYEGSVHLQAADMGIHIAADAELTVLPNIAGHIGGDITAALAAGRLRQQDGTVLLIDIGTNGEIVLKDGSRILACSTAAGPALEGAAISCGMRAADGAISRVTIDDSGVRSSVIGDGEASGICGSGLIDAVAQMLDAGIIDEGGRLADAVEACDRAVNRDIADRLVLTDDGERAFVIEKRTTGHDLMIRQKDIRQFQLAKGAIRAGIRVLLAVLKKRENEIDRLIVAGAFGSSIDVKNARRVGILPEISTDRVQLIGNAAGAGVSMTLTSESEMDDAEKTARLIEHIELTEYPEFQDVFISSLNF